MGKKQTMYRRPDGLYEKKVTLNGKRITFRGKTELEVFKKMAEYREEDSAGPLFKDVANIYRHKVEQMKYGTQRSYLPALQRAIDEFGEMRIKTISSSDLTAFLVKNATYGYKTVSNQKTVLNGIFNVWVQSKEWRGDANPALLAKIPCGLKRGTREPPPKEFVDIVKKSYKDKYGLFPFLLVYTGMRRGEALGLKWGDIDFERRQIHIERSVTHKFNVAIIDETKTKAGVRAVPLLENLYNVLFPIKDNPEYFVFGGERPLTKSEYDRRWQSYCIQHSMAHREVVTKVGNKVNIWKEDVSAHQFRHEYCTVLFEAGIDEKTAQVIMGHADLSTMRNVYTHLRAKKLADATEQLNSFVAQ